MWKNLLCYRFRDTVPKTGAEIVPSKEDFGHVRENPPSATTQKGAQLTENTVNTGQEKSKNNLILSCTVGNLLFFTEKTFFSCSGMNHIEGGWPKEINFMDSSQTSRIRFAPSEPGCTGF